MHSYECTKCDHTFLNKSQMDSHLQDVHNTTTLFPCLECGKKYADEYKLKRHSEEHKKKSFPTCDKCGKEFSRITPLKRHLDEEHGQQQFVCTKCDTSYTRKETLSAHMQSHTDDDSYRCQFCDTFYLTKTLLDKHMKIHTSKLKFECNDCNKAFASKKSLSLHMRTHFGKSSIDTITKNNKQTNIIDSNNTAQVGTIDKGSTSRNSQHISESLSLSNMSFTGIRFENKLYDCYLNSCINAIMSSHRIRNIINNSDKSDVELKTLQMVLRGDGTQTIQTSLRYIHKDFHNDKQQHDAHEFLIELLQCLKKL